MVLTSNDLRKNLLFRKYFLHFFINLFCGLKSFCIFAVSISKK